MFRWLSPFLVVCLVHRAMALRQADNLAVLEVDHDPEVITAVVNDVVYGSLMVLTVNPEMFANDIEVPSAAQRAVERAVEARQMLYREVSVSLSWLADFPHATRVDFQVAFDDTKHRQAFTQSVATDRGKNLTGMICAGVPRRFKAGCVQPAASLLQLTDKDFALSLAASDTSEVAGAALHAAAACYGNITVLPEGPAESALKDPQWKEAVAISIAEMARVSRLQVGTLMAAAAPAVRVDFWLSRGTGTCSQAAMGRVMRASITHLTNWQLYRWREASKESTEFVVYGRMMLEVPDQRLFAASTSVEEAVQRAVAQVAAEPGPEIRLSVTSANASLAAVGNLSNSVRVGFQVGFNSPSDRQVFYVDFARDMGQRLLNTINRTVSACQGRCRLPVAQLAAAPTSPSDAELDERYGSFTMWDHTPQRLVSDPLVQDAMALAVSQLASVPYQQVGTLVVNQFSVVGDVHFWVLAQDARLRQAAIQLMESAGRSKFFRCTLAQLDRLHDNLGSTGPAGMSFVSIVLQVPEVRSFANSTTVLAALRGAVAQLNVLPIRQVPEVWDFTVRSNLWEETLQLVRVDLRVALGTEALAKNFTRALAGDGGVKLVRSINKLVPEPFKGNCRLPLQARNMTLSPEQPYGTMLIRAFSSETFIYSRMEEAVATTIAEVALVPRLQVGLMMTRKSPVLVSIDFWVTSANATLRQVAIRRVNRDWTDKHLKLVWQRRGRNDNYPVFMVGGGTLLNGPGRFSCDGPGV